MNSFGNILLKWYRENKRNLPWREVKDPYLIWISEIILQQTRVAQGYDYYQRFITRFPDVMSLAEADEDEVLRYWQGLGYYSRARNLHAAAKSLPDGVFPTTYEGVRAMKGVGDYTAAAICSFSYNMPYAVVDGNVYRVLSRYFGIDTPIDTTSGKKAFAALAQDMLDKERPGEYNQAIMDFGAIVCTPQSPDCLFCPLANSCAALSEGAVSSLPVKQHKARVTNRYFNYLIVRVGKSFIIHKRTDDDIWKNLFELPLIETEEDVGVEDFFRLKALADFLHGHPEAKIRPLARGVKHVLSHRILYTNFYEVVLPDGDEEFEGYIRVQAEDLEHYAFPRLVHAFLEKYLKKRAELVHCGNSCYIWHKK